MQDKYITKTDINGNTTRLIIDHTKKLIIYGYSCPIFARSEATTTTQRNINRILKEYKEAGYKEV